MIVVLSYYSDGSDTPKVFFIPKDDRRLEELTTILCTELNAGKYVEAWKIEEVFQTPVQIIPVPKL